MAVEIFRSCEGCSGTGTVTKFGVAPYTCPDCEGSGKMLFSDSDDLSDKLDEIKAVVDAILTQVS